MFQTFKPHEYVMIDIASNYGHDKESWDFRINWFKENEHQLISLIPTAENPAMFFAGIQAWAAYKEGKPSGYPISLDGTSSGLQLLACLRGDRKAAELCNVVDTGVREDAYTKVYKAMLAKIGDSAKISRSDIKSAIMTGLYGSEAVPEAVFGEGTELLKTFYETMNELAPGAWELNQAFLAMWDANALSYNWILPDNFHVQIKVIGAVKENVHFRNAVFEITQRKNMTQKKGRSIGANVTHSVDSYVVRELTRRCNYDPEAIMQIKTTLCAAENQVVDMDCPYAEMVSTLWEHYKKTGMLSTRIFDYLTEENVCLVTDRSVVWRLIYSLPRKPFTVMAIHDCYRALPAYGNDLRQQYNNLLSEVAQGTLLNNLLTQLLGRPFDAGKLNPELWKEVKQTNYALS